MSRDGRIWLSHTGMESLERCPRCFWLQYKKGIRQPEGIVSRLANRFDTVMKNYFSIFRSTGKLPPMVEGKLEGRLQNPFVEKYFIQVNNKYGFYGKLDECLINSKGELIPIDFKTASSDPREKETLSAYQSQIDAYLFLLKENGNKITEYGYLVYLYPDMGQNLHDGFPMIVHVKKITGKPERTIPKINHAIEVLEKQLPQANPECNFCRWYKIVRIELDEKKEVNSQLSIV